jgi:hypothetical protein
LARVALKYFILLTNPVQVAGAQAGRHDQAAGMHVCRKAAGGQAGRQAGRNTGRHTGRQEVVGRQAGGGGQAGRQAGR